MENNHGGTPAKANQSTKNNAIHSRMKSLTAAIAAALALPVCSSAEEPVRLSLAPVAAMNMLDLTLEELATMKVTSVSRGPESLATAPAAISVVTDEDIRRAGVRNIPDALRLVPGLAVAQQDAHTFAVSSRGFNNAFANKMLVLMDGRSVYSPLFSGTLWEMQDTVLEDIDRIEVIRGPGATLWGANAVNGVISVNTKHAKETLGVLATGGGGTEEQAFGSIRYGVKLGEDVWLRVFGKYDKRDDSMGIGGGNALDDSETMRGGFRLDWEPTSTDKLTLQGDIFNGTAGQTFLVPRPSPPPQLPPGIPLQFIPPQFLAALQVPVTATIKDDIRFSGGNVMGRWAHDFSAESSAELRAYYDRADYSTPVFSEERDTVNIDLQHRYAFTLGLKQEVTWGLGYRWTEGRATSDSLFVTFQPRNRTDQLFSGFIQDKISLSSELQLILGTKVEHNDYTGWEWQPSARLLWTPATEHTLWASAARAVRTPSRVESDGIINLPGFVPGVATVHGTTDFQSEKLMAYELGYRWRPNKRLNFDVSLFYNQYDSLRSGIFDPATLRVDLKNEFVADTYGGEFSMQWQAADWLRIQGGYSFFQESNESNVPNVPAASWDGASPQNQAFLRSMFDLPGNVTFDATLRYVDSLTSNEVPAYFTADARLAWSPSERVEFAIVGRNLLDSGHKEFSPSELATQRTEVPRSVFGQVTIRF
jgi:iron complex outermembrane recepter protein